MKGINIAAAQAPEVPTRPGLVLIGVGLASFMGCLDLTIVNTALPAIRNDLSIDVVSGQWAMTAFLLALAGLMVVAGRAADTFGHARVLYAGIGLFGAASLGAGLSIDASSLILSRFAQGAGCAILYTVSAAIVSDAYPPAQRGWAIGRLFGINGIGLAAGPVLGGGIVEFVGWRSVFLINLPLLAISAWLCFANLRAKRGSLRGGLDGAGAAVLFITIAAAVVWLSGMPGGHNRHSWEKAVVAPIAACGILVFFFIERRARRPIVDFGLLRSRRFVAAILTTAYLAFFYSNTLFLVSAWLINLRGASELQTGLMLLATTASMAVLSPLVGRLVDRFGTTLPLVVGPLFLGLSGWLQSGFDLTTPFGTVILALVTFGIGWGAILGPSTAAALGAAPDGEQASATGVAWTLHNIGGAIGLAWLAHLGGSTGKSLAANNRLQVLYTKASGDLAVLALVVAAAVLLLLISGRRDVVDAGSEAHQ